MAGSRKITQKDERVARNIQRIRRDKGITQQELAERVGVSATWIGYIEQGREVPNLKLVYKIADALGVRVREIFPF